MKTLTPEQFKQKYGEVGVSMFSNPTKPQTQGVGDRLADTGNEMMDRIQSNIQGTGEASGKSLLNRGVNATAAVGTSVLKGAYDIAPHPVRQLLDFAGDKISQGFNAASEKLGDTELFKGAAQGDTAKLEDTLGIASGSGEIAGAITAFEGGAKSLQKGSNIAKNTATKYVDTVGKGVGNAVDSIATSTQNSLQLKPDAIMQKVARIPKGKQIKFKEIAGESVGEYLTKRGIFGNVEEISQKLYDRFSKSKSTADETLAKLPGTYKPAQVKTMLQELINREKKVSTQGAPSADLETIKNLATNFKDKGLTHPEINAVKRMYERNNTMDYLRQNVPESVAKAKNIDSAVRNWQRSQAKLHGVKNFEQINKETQLSRQLMDALGKEHAGQAGNNAVSLTDWIMLSGGDPTAIAGFLTKKTFSSESVRAAIAKALNNGKPVMGDVQADIGPSNILQLPEGKLGVSSENFTAPQLPSRRLPDEKGISKTSKLQ